MSIFGGMKHEATQPVVDRLLHIKQVAADLGICIRGVWRLVASGELRQPVKVGSGSARFPASEVAAYIERIKRERRR